MRIAIVGKFNFMHDEEYIARSFEANGHDIIRVPQNMSIGEIHRKIVLSQPQLVIFTKWDYPDVIKAAFERGKKEWGMKTVCWVFDLYWDYEREDRVRTAKYFKADYVFSTDGGHDEKWKEKGIKHQCVRQGIYDNECYLLDFDDPEGIAFVGSENPFFPERTEMMLEIAKAYRDFHWYGRSNTNQVRGELLNRLYSRKKIIIGNSVYSPYYWSNRIVETLGRGGFLIHQEVEGLKEEYPYLVTYKKGSLDELKAKIDYYLVHEKERQEIVETNFEWVSSRYTMSQKCEELISKL